MKKCWCGNSELSEYSDYYWACNKCHSLLNKEEIIYDPESICDDSDFYGKDYWEVKMVDAAQAKDMSEVVDLYLAERAVYWLKSLFDYLLPGSGSVAEVGCGLGQFSYLLKASGYQQKAFELSPEICGYIKKTLGINIECGGFKESKKGYDLIVAFDVIEHLTDPKGFLSLAKMSLKDNGLLLLQTPNYNPEFNYSEMLVETPIFEEQLKNKEHIFLFSKQSICKLLNEFGFKYVAFLNAFFGDDYDMFLIASRKPLRKNTPKEIDEALNSLENGRLIKALIKTWSDARKKETHINELEKQQNDLFNQINELTECTRKNEELAQAKDKRLADLLNQISELSERTVQAERSAQEKTAQQSELLSQIVTLTEMVKTTQEKLRISEDDRAARLEQINLLTSIIKEKNN